VLVAQQSAHTTRRDFLSDDKKEVHHHTIHVNDRVIGLKQI